MRIFFLFILGIFFSCDVWATQSMRNCSLLPISDDQDNKIGPQVFVELENHIRASSWCIYKSNLKLIKILSQNATNLETHLNNKDILKVIAEKTNSGSLIKINLKLKGKRPELSLEIIGDNGVDRYFKETAEIEINETPLIIDTLKGWLDLYEKTIPYDGRITEISKKYFIIELGKSLRVDIKDDVGLESKINIVVERQIREKKNSDFKDEIEFEFEKIADAKIIESADHRAHAVITKPILNKEIQVGDWIRANASTPPKVHAKITHLKKELLNQKNEIKKERGTATLFLVDDFSSVSQSGTYNRSMKSNLIGFNLIAHYNYSNKYWFVFDYESKSGNYKTNEGSFTLDSNSTKNNHLRLLAGYKYNPNLDFYLGYADYTYAMEASSSDYFDRVHFAGAIMGLKTNITLTQKINSYTLIDIIIPAGFTSTAKTLGQDTSTLNYRAEIGAHYAFKTNFLLTGGISLLANQVSLLVPGVITEEKFNDLSLKIGTTFRF